MPRKESKEESWEKDKQDPLWPGGLSWGVEDEKITAEWERLKSNE